MRARIARHLHRIAAAIDRPPVPAMPYDDPHVTAIKDQTKVIQNVADELRENTGAVTAVQDDRRLNADRARLEAMEGDPLPADGLPLRIDSDGVGMNTVLKVGDTPITNAIRVTWSITGAGVARALVEFDQVEARMDGHIVGS